MAAALKTFISRLSSSVTLWAVFAAIFYWAYEPGLCAIIVVLVLRGLHEFYGMLAADKFPHFRGTGITIGAVMTIGALIVASQLGPDASFMFQSGALLVGVLLVFTRQIFHRSVDTLPLSAIGFTVLGLVYIPYLGANTINLVYLTPKSGAGQLTGHFYLLYLAAVTKMSDCGAYVTGSLIGKHPMIPRISPKKTWEGFFGALGHSVLVSVILVKVFPEQLTLIGGMSRAPWVGLILGFVAVLGDLAESLLKRSTHIKDSGHFLPGIGGALDLIDSMLFTAPLLYLYLRYFSSF